MGSVTIRVECVSQLNRQLNLRFSVTDTGMGIPEGRRDLLFAPFSQVDRSTSRQFGGSGLGLSICKQLVELMGGTLGVESQVGVGSTFWFELPVQLGLQDVAVAQDQHVLDGRLLLVVNGRFDSERQQLSDCLQAWKCRIEQVVTLTDALEVIARAESAGDPFTTVLADCPLVEGDEYVLLQKLTKNPSLPIIGLSTGLDDQAIAYLHQLGVRRILCAPIRPSVLFNVLATVLSVETTFQSNNVPTPPQAEVELPLTGHLLVAEDNHINQILVIELLKYCGCTCDVVGDGGLMIEMQIRTRSAATTLRVNAMSKSPC